MSTFTSYIAVIGALASNLPYVVSVAETISPDICPMFDTETDLVFETSKVDVDAITLGDAAGVGELRFNHLFVDPNGVQAKNIDLVVTQAPGTIYTYANLEKNGKKGAYGQINIATNQGEGTFNFCFENSVSKESMTLDTFFFSILDLDGNDATQGFETVSIRESNFTRYYLGGKEHSQVEVSENNGVLNFESTDVGYYHDNPEDLDDLTPLQKNRTVMFQMDDTECFTMKFASNCASGCENGRNFMFAGKVPHFDPDCITAAPTITPPTTDFPTTTPTESPTTTHPTESPTTTHPTESPTTTHPTESPVTSNPTPGSFGDPHIITWTGKTYDFHGVCDLVLFSNPSFDNGSGVVVHIRNKRMSMWSFVESSAIRIGKDTFELTGGKDNDNFLINGIVQNRKNKNGVVGSISGYDIKFTQVNENSRKFMINLGTNKNNNKVEQIIFTTWKSFVSVSVKNPTKDHFDGSMGLMGSFPAGVMVARDGKTVLDDSNEFGQEWQVLSTEPELFAHRGTVGPNDMCSIPSSIEMRRRLQASVVTLKDAENACNSVNNEMKDLCIFDVMATNDKSSSGVY